MGTTKKSVGARLGRRAAFGVVVAALVGLSACGTTREAATRQSVYDRVVASGVIRASYANYAPYGIKDANTGKLSGIFVDALEEIGRRLELKIDWTEEVGYGEIFASLNADRVDMFGSGLWQNASRGKAGLFSRPVIYNVIKVWGRPGESRIKTPADLNQAGIRISTADGAIEDLIAKSDFPLAARVSQPQTSPWTDVLLNITTNKADVTFAEPAAVNLFLDKNPGVIVELLPAEPLRVFSNAYAFKGGEDRMRAMIDAALDEISDDGTLNRIIQKYERRPGEFLRRAPQYSLSTGGR